MNEMKKTLICLLLALMLPCLSLADRGTVTIIEGEEKSAPELPLAGYKIGIDPGHQLHGDNSREPVAPGSSETKAKVATGTSGVYTHKAEHETNLEIALLLRDLLVDMGAEVLMTRETADVNISNVECATMMNEWGADAVVRLHCNGSTDHSVHGMGMYVRKTGEKAEESEALARCLLSSMTARTGARAQGVYTRDTYSGLTWSQVPSVLVEMGYMTNPDEDRKLNDPDYQVLIVLGIADGLTEYLTHR